MLIISVMGVTNISGQFFNTLVGMGSRSHDFDDELISSSVARSKGFILDLISGLVLGHTDVHPSIHFTTCRVLGHSVMV